MLEGLSKDAQLRLKVVMDGLDKSSRELDQWIEEVGTDAPKAVRNLSDEISRAKRNLDEMGTAATKGGASARVSAEQAASAWKAAVKEMSAYDARYKQYVRGQITGQTPADALRLSDFSEADKTNILAIDDANNADVVSAIRRERAERAAANAEAIAGIDRMSAAFDKRVEVERRAERERAKNSSITLKDWDAEFKALEREIAGREKRTGSMISERYALYDVASTATLTSAAILGMVAAYEAVAISRQRAFADVQRTAGYDAQSGQIGDLKEVRDELVQLTRELPKSFGELASTAAVGGQAGLKPEDLADYVEAVTKFSTTESLNADFVGDKLSKLRNILGLTAEGYNLLANSIAYAGNESAASSSEVIAVAEEIAPYARQAGFAATETIGLATALASLQVPPERARSAFQEMARSIDNAVVFGGEKLSNFASISGMTVEEFTEMWRTKPATAFQAFTRGFASVDNAAVALRTMGLDGQRVTPVLLSLANNADLVAESFQNAQDGVSNGFLDKAFAATVATVAEQFQLLVNEITNLADAIGGPTLGAINLFIGGARNLLQWLTSIADTPLGQFLSVTTTGIAVLVGTITLLVGILAVAGASFLALRFAVGGLNGLMPPTIAYLANLVLGLFGVKVAAAEASTGITTATVATRGLRFAVTGLLASTGVGLLVTLLGSLAGEALNVAQSQSEAEQEVTAATAAMEEQGGVAVESAEQLRELVEASYEWLNVNAGLEGSLYALGQSMGKNGTSFSAYSEAGRSNIQALERAITSAADVAGGDALLLSNLLAGLREQLISAGASSEAFEVLNAAIESTGRLSTEAVITSNSLAVGMRNIEDAAGDAAGATSKLGDTLRTVSDYADDLNTMFSRSYELRFGTTTAYDKVLSQYSQMRKNAKDAADGVEDLRNQIAQTEADLRATAASRAGLEYSLSIAGKYGDTIRTAQIAAEIAKLNADEGKGKSDLVDLNQQLVEQQEALSNSLIGNSDAAIKNRDDVLSLVAAYQSYIDELANSGASQEELQAASAALRDEFVNQLEQMGYSGEQVDYYAGQFDNLAQIIREYPREVDIEVKGLSEGQAAIEEFLARNANREIGVAVAVDQNGAYQEGVKAGEAIQRGLKDFTSPRGQAGFQNTRSYSSGNGFLDWFSQFFFLPDLGFYDQGGYTGDGGKFDFAGYAHKGEYIFPQEAVRYYGVENLAYAHRRAVRGYADGGFVGGGAGLMGALGGGGGAAGPVSLDRASIDAIAEAISNRPAVLVADGRALAQTVGSANAASTRGS